MVADTLKRVLHAQWVTSHNILAHFLREMWFVDCSLIVRSIITNQCIATRAALAVVECLQAGQQNCGVAHRYILIH